MFARRPVPTTTEQISRALGLDARIADLDRMLTRHRERLEEERDAAAIDAAEDARVAAEYAAMMEREAEAELDAIDAGDCDAGGKPIPYDTYRSAV